MRGARLQDRMFNRSTLLKATAWMGLSGLMFAAPMAQAVPFSTDVVITGSASFDNGFASGELSGSGAQSGSFSVTSGLTTDTSTFTDAATSGTNPLSGALTDLGDGLALTGRASASDDGTFGIGIDFGLNLTNNSATDSYKIIFDIVFDHNVDASGGDAFSESDFQVYDRANNNTLFFTHLMSDTLGVSGPMSDSGSASFEITLAAGQSLGFDPALHDLAWTLRGGAFAAGSAASANLGVSLSIASVENLTPPPPNPVPEPATLALLGLGLLGLGAMRRRPQ